MENTNLSEEDIVLMQLESYIETIEYNVKALESQLIITKDRLEKLKERKKLILNYLKTDNSKAST